MTDLVPHLHHLERERDVIPPCQFSALGGTLPPVMTPEIADTIEALERRSTMAPNPHGMFENKPEYLKFSRDRTQDYCDATIGCGVMVELVRESDDGEWEVWGVRIDGNLYREPRDLSGEILADGPFKSMLNQRFCAWLERETRDAA